MDNQDKTALASQSQATQPTRQQWDYYGTGVLPWSFRTTPNQPMEVIADAMQRELNDLRPLVAAHLAGTSQATKAQAEPVAALTDKGRAVIWNDNYRQEPWVSKYRPLYLAAPVAKEASQLFSPEDIVLLTQAADEINRPAGKLQAVKVQAVLEGGTSEQQARYAIDGAIQYGRENRNPPPSADHWLYEYWNIGQQLRRLGETGWDNVTPLTASVAKEAPAVPEGSTE